MTEDRLYEMAWRELDHGYIADVGRDVRRWLESEDVVELDYEPGDMTRYPTTFVPLSIVEQVGGKPAWPGVTYESGVLVALGGSFGSAYAINLLDRPSLDFIHFSYVAEHWLDRKRNASAVAVALLLEAVAGVKSFDPTAEAVDG